MEDRVGVLEAALGRVSLLEGVERAGPAPVARLSLTAHAADLASPASAQLYGTGAYEASRPLDEGIEQLAAKAELQAAIDLLINPYKDKIGTVLGPYAQTVKKLPARPGPDAKRVYDGYTYLARGYLYDTERCAFVNTNNSEEVQEPEVFLTQLAGFLGRIPTLGG